MRVFLPPPLRIRQESRYLFLDFIFILFSFFLRAFFILISYFLVIWLCEPAGCFFLLLLLSRGIYTTHRGAVDVDILLLHLVLFFFSFKKPVHHCNLFNIFINVFLSFLFLVSHRRGALALTSRWVDALDVRIYASVPILVIPEWNDG
jgi:hypothetical protein